MLLTRIGEGSKFVVTGDLEQHDRGFKNNGLKDFMSKLIASGSNDRLAIVKFGMPHVERHPAVAEILKIYDGQC